MLKPIRTSRVAPGRGPDLRRLERSAELTVKLLMHIGRDSREHLLVQAAQKARDRVMEFGDVLDRKSVV